MSNHDDDWLDYFLWFYMTMLALMLLVLMGVGVGLAVYGAWQVVS